MSWIPSAPHVRLGWLAAVLAVSAGLADLVAPAFGARDATWISPVDLARRIRDGSPDLDLVDVRGAEDYEAGHIPTARNAPLPDFDGSPAASDQTMVVYAGTDDQAIEAAVLAQEETMPGHVLVLERGIEGWLDDIMAPRIARNATESERAVFAARSELSRWFGGVPRVVDTITADATPPEAKRSARLLGGC